MKENAAQNQYEQTPQGLDAELLARIARDFQATSHCGNTLSNSFIIHSAFKDLITNYTISE